MTILIVGAGLSGCVLAREYAGLGKKVIVLEKRNHLAGNCFDYRNEHGILVSQYGPHIFHTNSDRVWDYVNRFCRWIPYTHRVSGTSGGKLFPVPINIETVNIVHDVSLKDGEEMRNYLTNKTVPCSEPKNSEDLALSRFGPTIYNAIIKEYTMKQWNRHPRDLDPSVVGRIPIRFGWEDKYFSDKYQALPEKGYTSFVEEILNHPNITVNLSTEYSPTQTTDFEKVFYTGPIDAFFKNSGLPPLEYRSLRFEEETLDTPKFQPTASVNYCSLDVPYTRITEYKHFYGMHQSEKTTIVKEYPSDVGEPYYPIMNDRNRSLYEEYKRLASDTMVNSKVYFVGRLANYKYFNMDEAILNALQIFDSLKEEP